MANPQQEIDMMAELGKIQTLIWRLVGGFCVVFFCVFAALGGGFVLLVNADAQQDLAISEKPGLVLLAQYQEANKTEHDIMMNSMSKMETSIAESNNKMANMDTNVAEIKGFLEGLKEVLKEVVNKKDYE